METRWFIASGKLKLGPFPFAELRRQSLIGRLLPDTFILQEGTSRWAPASSLAGLFPVGAPSLPRQRSVPPPLPPAPAPPLPFGPAIPVAAETPADGVLSPKSRPRLSAWRKYSRLVTGMGGVLVLTAFVIWYALRHSNDAVPEPSQGQQRINLELPAGATADVKPKATLHEDLSALPEPPRGGRLLAAGKFEPSGAEFPKGLKVTWLLAEKRDPESTLWIVVLDETTRAWKPTGWTATVGANGTVATGTVYHFTELAATDADPGPVSNDPNADKKIADRPPTPTPDATAGAHVHEVGAEKLKEVERIYQKTTGGKADSVIDEAGMQQLYKAGGFAVLKTLIENRVISVEHSMQMADLRILMCMKATERVLASHQGKWKIYRSDSGNQNSGMASDIDQTVFVYVKDDKTGHWQRAEGLDSVFVRLTRKRKAQLALKMWVGLIPEQLEDDAAVAVRVDPHDAVLILEMAGPGWTNSGEAGRFNESEVRS